MDALSPMHPARRVVFMKGAQVGATESGSNWLGYIIHWSPAPVMAVWPTVDMAKKASQQRVAPLIEDSPELARLVAPAKQKDSGNTVLAKSFPGGILIMTGANSAVGLRSMPARYAFLDEVDAYPGDVDGEGDPVGLVKRRTNTFGRSAKMFLVSTPTIHGASRIEREYEMSDQRRYNVPCPHCGCAQWLKFERLRWERGAPETSVYVCEHCEESIEERHKATMLPGGFWEATAVAQDPDCIGLLLDIKTGPNTRHRAYPDTDARHEASLDYLEFQAIRRLAYDAAPMSVLFRKIARIRKAECHRQVMDDSSVKIAARILTLTCEVSDDQVHVFNAPDHQPTGIDALPEPLRSVAAALPEGSSGADVVAAIIAAMSGLTVPALDGIDITSSSDNDPDNDVLSTVESQTFGTGLDFSNPQNSQYVGQVI